MAATMTEDEMRSLLDWQEADARDAFSFEPGHEPESDDTHLVEHHHGWTQDDWIGDEELCQSCNET